MNNYPLFCGINKRNAFEYNRFFNCPPNIPNFDPVNGRRNFVMPPNGYGLSNQRYVDASSQKVCDQLKTNINGNVMRALKANNIPDWASVKLPARNIAESKFQPIECAAKLHTGILVEKEEKHVKYQETEDTGKIILPTNSEVASGSFTIDVKDSSNEILSDVLQTKNGRAVKTSHNLLARECNAKAADPMECLAGLTLGEIWSFVKDSSEFAENSRRNGWNSKMTGSNLIKNRASSTMTGAISITNGSNSITNAVSRTKNEASPTINVANSSVTATHMTVIQSESEMNITKILGRFTVRQLIDNFNKQENSNSSNGQAVQDNNVNAEGMRHFSDILNGHTSAELMRFLSGIEVNQDTLAAESVCLKAETSECFNRFTGYSLVQIMASLNESEDFSNGYNARTNTEFSSVDRTYSCKMKTIEDKICIRKRTDNPGVEPGLKPGGISAEKPLKGISRNGNEIKNENTVKTVLASRPEDYDTMNKKQFEKLSSENAIETWSEYCLKFGHSDDICPYGSLCKFKNKDLCMICERYVLSPNDPLAKLKHRDECFVFLCWDRENELLAESREIRNAGSGELRRGVTCEATCQMCNRTVTIESSVSSRLYVLPCNCEHVICRICAQTCFSDLPGGGWRNVMICGVCGIVSPVSAVCCLWREKGEKQRYLAQHGEVVKSLKCMYCTKLPDNSRLCIHGQTLRNKHSVFTMAELNMFKSNVTLNDKVLAAVQEGSEDWKLE